MFKFKIQTKILLTILLILIVALTSLDLMWFSLIQPILRNHLYVTQSQLGLRAATKIENFIDAKVRTLILHSQSSAFASGDKPRETFEMVTLLLQDQDIERIGLIDKVGKETIALTRDHEIPPDQLQDRSQSPTYLVTTFRFGQEYLSEVEFKNLDNKPYMTMAVPVVIPSHPRRLTELSTTSVLNFGKEGDILGVLEIEISLEKVLDEVAGLGQDLEGVLYIVDSRGQLIAHNTKKDLNRNAVVDLPPVKNHLNEMKAASISNQSTASSLYEYQDIDRNAVFASSVHIPVTNWGVIIEQQSSILFDEVSEVFNFGFIFLLLVIGIAIPISYLLSRSVTNPIRKLTMSVKKFDEIGSFEALKLKTGDEVEDLSQAFNEMGVRIQDSREALVVDRDVIKAERNKLSLVLGGIADAVIAFDAQGKVVLINQAAEKLTGWSKEDAVSKLGDEILNLYDMESSKNIKASNYMSPAKSKTRRNQNYFRAGVKLTTRDGKEKFVNFLSSWVHKGMVVNVAYIVTLHDVSEEKELDKMKLDFVSMAAHELRTPLTTVRGYLSFLQDPVSLNKLNDEEKEYLNRASVSAVRLNNLVENLLSVSKIEQGGVQIKPEPINIENVVESIVNEFRGLANSKRLVLVHKSPDKKLPQVKADKFRIAEVVVNLVGNAINYTQSGEIEVSYKEEGKDVIVAVHDTGQGIPQDAIQHLFTKFFRIQGELQSGSKGTGLGLYLSKRIIEAHGGKIWVESKLNVGSTFYFSLPIVK